MLETLLLDSILLATELAGITAFIGLLMAGLIIRVLAIAGLTDETPRLTIGGLGITGLAGDDIARPIIRVLAIAGLTDETPRLTIGGLGITRLAAMLMDGARLSGLRIGALLNAGADTLLAIEALPKGDLTEDLMFCALWFILLAAARWAHGLQGLCADMGLKTGLFILFLRYIPFHLFKCCKWYAGELYKVFVHLFTMASKRFLAVFILLLLMAAVLLMGTDALLLPYYALLSTGRMALAFVISLLFSLIFGLWMGHSERAFRYLLPFMDILQSVPILGFLPVAVIFLKEIPLLGSEAATIFLIFSCMAWAMLFNIVEGVRSMPLKFKDLSQLMGLRGIRYLSHVAIPAIEPQIISGAVAGWGGGWYFLVVGEYTTFGSIPHEVPGIGQFIAESAYSGEIALSLLGIWALAAVVLLFNKFLWGPLQRRAHSYKKKEPEPFETDNPAVNLVDRIGENALAGTERYLSWIGPLLEKAGVRPASSPAKPSRKYSIALFSCVAVALVALFLFYQDEIIVPGGLLEPFQLFWYSLNSISRILVAYAIALAWTLAAGIYIGKNKKLRDFFMPIFDIGQSVPAVAVFPIIVVSVIHLVGGELGIDIASVLLLLTGMQWYLLFNIIRAMQSIPERMTELGSMLNLSRVQKLRNIILPAIFPAVVAGSIQAIGGGWNATIISEYIVYKSEIYSPSGGGLGWLLNVGTAEGSLFTVAAVVLTMVVIIIGTDKLIWSRGVKKAEKYSSW